MIGGEVMKRRHFTMSAKEIDRISVLEKLTGGEIKIGQAAEALQLSTRQVKRLKKRFVRFGPCGLVHKNRGRQSNRAIPKEEIKRVLKIVIDNYSDFGPTFALEKLKQNHGVILSRERLRLAMIEKGVWKVKKKRSVVVYQTRRRRDREGELVQIDGSPHLWFEKRGLYCTLLVYVDDATGKLKYLRFVDAETTNNYFRATYAYIKKFGKPAAFYSDKHGVFRVNTRKGNTAAVDDSNGLTQFGRAMAELGITPIFANSPQAKGRVEKANGTLQDRLVKEMRLRGISTMAEGNAYLNEFMDSYNQKFAVQPFLKEDAHRPLLKSENLLDILVLRETRTLSKNLEFAYKNQLYQIRIERPPYCLRYVKVTVLENWDGKIRVYYRDRQLQFEVIQRLPEIKIASSKEIYQEVGKVVRQPWKPAENHPWRHFSI